MGHHGSSWVISGRGKGQGESVAASGHIRQGEPLSILGKGSQWQPVTILGKVRPCHQRSSVVISSHPRPSEVIRGHP